MNNNGKFLVNLLDQLGNQKLFFGFWLLVVIGTIFVILRHRKSLQTRNFRDRPYKGSWKKTQPKSSVPAVVESDDDDDVVKINPK